jgi:hypothetical protein
LPDEGQMFGRGTMRATLDDSADVVLVPILRAGPEIDATISIESQQFGSRMVE